MTKLKIYGENAFTFLFFDGVRRRGCVRDLLQNLKSFDGSGRTFRESALASAAEAEIWLFPSFGKRAGFGEPDALVLIDGCAFWFEVETDVDLESSRSSMPLIQLFRFHCAALAFQRGPRNEGGARIYSGASVTGSRERKDARLKLRGHAASGLIKTLREAREHHFVLLSIHKPRAGGKWRERLPKFAAGSFSKLDALAEFDNTATKFPLVRTWYVYWAGDLKEKWKWPHETDDPLKSYVSIKRD